MQPLWGVLALSVALGALAWALQTGRSMLAPIGATLAAWLVLGALAEIAGRMRLGRAGAAETLRRAWNLPRADWGKALAHAGFGVSDLRRSPRSPPGRARTSASSGPATRFAVRRLRAALRRRRAPAAAPNYATDVATVTILRDGRELGTLHPERRLYDVQGMATTEAGDRPRPAPATSTSRSASRSRTAPGRSGPTSSRSPTGSGSAR